MHSDPISDLLTRIRNASMAGKKNTSAPYSKIKEQILNILQKNKFISSFKVNKKEQFPTLEIELNTERNKITLKRISKPGQRIYIKATEIKQVRSGLGFSIISTPKGLLTNQEARKQNVGGELICQVY